MSEKISSIITDFLLRKNVIKEEEKEIYHYGYETLIYSIQQMMLILALGMIMNRKIETFTFLMVFVSMRKYTGGYHARSRLGCTFMTVVCYLMVLVLGEWLMNMKNGCIILLFLVLLCVVIFSHYVPMEHPEKPLTKDNNGDLVGSDNITAFDSAQTKTLSYTASEFKSTHNIQDSARTPLKSTKLSVSN